MATATLTKIGNSIGAVFPSEVRGNDFRLGDKLLFERAGDSIIVSHARKRPTLDSLMSGYDGEAPELIDLGAPYGRELW